MPPTLLGHITVDRGAGGFCAKKCASVKQCLYIDIEKWMYYHLNRCRYIYFCVGVDSYGRNR